MSIALRSARNFSVQIGTFAVTIFDRLVLTGLLFRAWGVETFSDWATLLAATGMLTVADLGFQTYLGTMLRRAQTRGRHRAFARIVRLGLFFYVAVGLFLLLCVTVLLLAVDVGQLLNLHGRNLALVFLALSLAQVLRVSRTGVTQIFRGMGEYYRFSLTDLRTQAVSAALSAGAVVAGASPLEVALIYLGVEFVLGTGLAIVQVRRLYPHVALEWERPSRSRAVRTAGTLSWYALYQLLITGFTHVPVLIIAGLGLSGPALAMFVVLRTLVNVARTIGANLCIAVGVELAPETEGAAGGTQQSGLEALARLNSALSALIAAGLFVFGDGIVAAWTGQGGFGSQALLAWLLLPVIVISPATPLQMVAIFSDRIRPQAIAIAVQSAIAIPGAVILGLHFGVVGVAAALAVGEVVGIGLISPLLAAKSMHVSYPRLALRSAAHFAICLLWALTIAILVREAVAVEGYAGLGFDLAIWGSVGALPVLWFSLPQGVQRRVKGLVRR